MDPTPAGNPAELKERAVAMMLQKAKANSNISLARHRIVPLEFEHPLALVGGQTWLLAAINLWALAQLRTDSVRTSSFLATGSIPPSVRLCSRRVRRSHCQQVFVSEKRPLTVLPLSDNAIGG
jgi:hypothetical protein